MFWNDRYCIPISDYHEDERAFEKLNSRLYPTTHITVDGRRKTGVS